MYAVGDRVLVDSALAFATVTEVHQRASGNYYVVQFPEGDTLWRSERDLDGGGPPPLPFVPVGECTCVDPFANCPVHG